MSGLAAERMIDGVRVWPDANDPRRFLYVPGAPQPQRGADGKPMVSLIFTGDTGILQVSAWWGIEAEETERLRTTLAAAIGDLEVGQVMLSPAAITVSEVALEVADGRGGFTVIATAPGSGFPPFTAVFSVVVAGEQRRRAVGALNGSAGSLRVRYRAEGAVRVSATARLLGRLSGVADGGTGPLDAAELEAALAAQGLAVTVEPGDAPEELAERARRLVLERAATALAAGSLSGKVEVAATAAADLPTAFEPTADVAGWFSEASHSHEQKEMRSKQC